MATCAFCGPTIEDIIIKRTENFTIIPTIGQISDGGHILIFPNDHKYASLGQMTDELFVEFEALKKEFQTAVIENYGPVMNFEHGVIGQTVPHAHLQMLPCYGHDLLFQLKEKYHFFKELKETRELRDIERDRRVYLYYQQPSDKEIEGRKFVFYMDAIPQYLRLEAASVMGRVPRGNWKEWRNDPDCARIDDELMRETIAKLK
jgi:diadenosine tetraphosphate (Ap4A) HIT family hydrolase